MSAEVQTAVINESLKLSDMFRQNSAMRHGIPRVGSPERITGIEPEQPAAVAATPETKTPQAIETPSPSGASAATASSSLLRRAAPFLLGGALAGLGPAGWALNSYFNPTTVVQPTATTPVDGDLFQWLQKNGHHLQEGWK